MINNDTVKQIAFLSRIRIDDDKLGAVRAEFNQILQWIEELDEVDTDGVEPLTAVNDTAIICRADEVQKNNTKEDILANAPEAKYGYFVVPKVVE